MVVRPFAADLGYRVRRRRGSAIIQPSALTNLRAWYKSDVGTTIVTGVSQWNDQSGNLNHLVQATGAAQPTLNASQINGLPALRFDGVDDNMTAAFALAQPLTIFMVARQIAWTSTRNFHDGITTADSMLLQQFSASPNLRMFAGSSLSGVTDLAVGSFGMITEIFNGASSLLQINSFPSLSGGAGAASPGGITLGSRQTATAFANIDVAEVIIMAAAATAAERAGIRAYVAQRYGF